MRIWQAPIFLAVAAAATAFTTSSAAPPNTTITAHPPTLTTSTSATFQFTSTPAGAKFECSLDNLNAFTTCTSPKTYASVSDRVHTFFVRAKSLSGTDPTPAHYTWTVDTTPPTVAAPQTSFGSSLGTGETVQMTTSLTASDSGSGLNRFQLLRRTGTTWSVVPLPSPTFTEVSEFLPAGTQILYAVRAVDNAGNVSSFRLGVPIDLEIVEDSSPGIAYTSAWDPVAFSEFHGGTARTSTTADSIAELAPSSPIRGIGIVSDFAPNRGWAEFTIHSSLGGSADGTVNLSQPTFTPRRILESSSYGTASMLTATVRVIGTFAAPSTSPRVDVDAFVILH